MWRIRRAGNAASINTSVEYVTTEAEKEKYVSFDVKVDYRPPPSEGNRHLLSEDDNTGAYDFNPDEVSHGNYARDCPTLTKYWK